MAAKSLLKDILTAENSEERIRGLRFEEGLKLLDELVTNVESGTIPLDEAVVSYEKGVQIITHLRDVLAGAEEKLKLLQKPEC